LGPRGSGAGFSDGDLGALPFDWNLDDAPYFSHESVARRPGLRSPDEVFEIWRAELEYLYRKLGYGAYVRTCHPQTIGKGSRVLMLERLIAHIKEHEGVRFQIMAEVASAFRASRPLAWCRPPRGRAGEMTPDALSLRRGRVHASESRARMEIRRDRWGSRWARGARPRWRLWPL
jgi:hypothetical protein